VEPVLGASWGLSWAVLASVGLSWPVLACLDLSWPDVLSIFDRFGTSVGMKNVQKPLVFVGQNDDACFCALNVLEIDLGGVLEAS